MGRDNHAAEVLLRSLKKDAVAKWEAKKVYFYDGKNFSVGSRRRQEESARPEESVSLEDLPKDFRKGTKVIFKYVRGADLCLILNSSMKRKDFLSLVSEEYTSRPERLLYHYLGVR